MKTLGIIGGMGPQATVDLYQKILNHTPANRDQEHLHVIIDSYPQIPDRTAYLLSGQGDDPLPYLLESAGRLQQAGVHALLMPCNTAHAFVPELRKRIQTPILHIAEAALAQIGSAHGRRIAVLATTGTQKAGIYRTALENAGYAAVEPDAAQSDALMRCIYEGAKAGKTAEYAPLMAQTVAGMDADAFILGCTEIPLFLPWWDDPRPTIDATDALAIAAVAFARNP